MTVSGYNNSNANVIINNMMGEIIYNSDVQIINNQIVKEISLGDTIPGGVYFVKVMIGNEGFVKELVISK